MVAGKRAAGPAKKVDVSGLRVTKTEPVVEEEPEQEPVSVSAGRIDYALDLAFNPSREKLPEVTVIDKFQGRLFPVVTLINIIWDDVIQIAAYREDKDEYRRIFKRARPKSKNWLDELLHSTAQWQKSIGGINLNKIEEIALAEMQNRTDEGEGLGGAIDAWAGD